MDANISETPPYHMDLRCPNNIFVATGFVFLAVAVVNPLVKITVIGQMYTGLADLWCQQSDNQVW